MKYARHGDLAIKQIDKLPKGVKVNKSKDRLVLAYGEITGHKHQIQPLEDKTLVNVWKNLENTYIQVEKGKAELVHEDHDTITFNPGPIYVVKNQRERDPFTESIRQVQD